MVLRENWQEVRDQKAAEFRREQAQDPNSHLTRAERYVLEHVEEDRLHTAKLEEEAAAKQRHRDWCKAVQAKHSQEEWAAMFAKNGEKRALEVAELKASGEWPPRPLSRSRPHKRAACQNSEQVHESEDIPIQIDPVAPANDQPVLTQDTTVNSTETHNAVANVTSPSHLEQESNGAMKLVSSLKTGLFSIWRALKPEVHAELAPTPVIETEPTSEATPTTTEATPTTEAAPITEIVPRSEEVQSPGEASSTESTQSTDSVSSREVAPTEDAASRAETSPTVEPTVAQQPSSDGSESIGTPEQVVSLPNIKPRTKNHALAIGRRHHPYLNGRRMNKSAKLRQLLSRPSPVEAPSSTTIEAKAGTPDTTEGLTERMQGFSFFNDWFKDDDKRGIGIVTNLVPPTDKLAQLEAVTLQRAADAEREQQERLARAKRAQIQQRRSLRQPNAELIPALSLEWTVRSEASVKHHSSAYTITAPEGTSVTTHDFRQLAPSNVWLNDNVIQASLSMLADAINTRAGVVIKKDTPKCVVSSSFFYTKFSEGSIRNPKRGFKTTWGVTPENFLDVDTFLLPINSNLHWTVLAIRPSARTIAYIDSFHSAGKEHLANGKKFLQGMLGDLYKPEEWQTVQYAVPRQSNGYDCGIFAITNSICIALGIAPNCYDPKDMPLQRKRMAAAILKGGFYDECSLDGL